MTTRVLVLTTDPVPLANFPSSGAGLRAWGLKEGLKSTGKFDVSLAFAADAIRGNEDSIQLPAGVETFERKDLSEYIRKQSPDILVFQHWSLLKECKEEIECPVAIDLTGPHLLERRLWNSSDPTGDIREKISALSRADYVVCSGKFQRHYFLPYLFQAGFTPDKPLCPVIPFSVSPELPPIPADRDFSTFVYAGMFLPWQNPSLVLNCLIDMLEEKGKGRLVFMGGPHPSGDVSQGRFDALMERLSGSKCVEVHGLLPFEEFVKKIRRCGGAIDLMRRNSERELAFPTRTITYLWAGLPVIHNNFDELAPLITEANAGWALHPEDEKEIRKRLKRLLAHQEDLSRRSENAQQLVTKHFTWDKTIAPLADWCEKPERRERSVSISLAESTKAEAPKDRTRKRGRPANRKKETQEIAATAPLTDESRGPWYLSPVVFILALPICAVLLLLFGLAELMRLFLQAFRKA